MLSYQIKTHKQDSKQTANQLFILNKGLNSGRPQNTPSRNCFTITASNATEKEIIFYVCQALWMGQAFHPMLKGSVILFITKQDFQKLLDAALRRSEQIQDIGKLITALQSITAAEENARRQLKTINTLKICIFNRYLS